MAAIALLLGTANATATAEGLPPQADPCDYQGPSGICIRVDHDAKALTLPALEAAYLKAKREMEARYQLDLTHVPAPVVRIVSFDDFAHLYPATVGAVGDSTSHFGWTSFESGKITITGPAVMQHEAYHYFLWHAGYSNRLNAAHDHPVFDDYRNRKSPPERTTPPLPATQEAKAGPESPSAAGALETTPR